MNYEETSKLLDEMSYVLECYSPLEISNQDGDVATGEFAEIVIADLKQRKKLHDIEVEKYRAENPE